MHIDAESRYHGGWLAPNIYFLGHAGCVQVDGIRIAGASGIFGGGDFRQGVLFCRGFVSLPLFPPVRSTYRLIRNSMHAKNCLSLSFLREVNSHYRQDTGRKSRTIARPSAASTTSASSTFAASHSLPTSPILPSLPSQPYYPHFPIILSPSSYRTTGPNPSPTTVTSMASFGARHSSARTLRAGSSAVRHYGAS